MDICSWCSNALEQSDNLIMCDECPRVFCDDCVIRAHGNGIAGESTVNKLLEDDGTWACIYCIPTKMLDAMRAFLKLDSDNGSVSSQIIDEGADKITTSQDKDVKLAENIQHHYSDFLFHNFPRKKFLSSYHHQYPQRNKPRHINCSPEHVYQIKICINTNERN
jgi:RNase adaptor protein for sRNA GlmZ degradation